MQTILIGAMFWALSNIAVAWDHWDQEKKNLFVASNVAIIADWATTINMTERYNEGYYEKNHWLGSNPSRAHVNKYMAGRMIVNYLATEYLPEPWDKINLYITTGVHGRAALRNHQIGLEFKF
jgi:hypothetical protein